MKPLDYRKALGLGFESSDRLSLLKTKTLNNAKVYEYYEYKKEELLGFCNAVGKTYFYAHECYEDAIEILEDLDGLEYLFAYFLFFL